MSTLSQMRSRIADDLDRSDLSTQIDKAINRAIEYHEKERFWFNETSGTLTTVANQESYSSSDAAFIANILDVDLVRITFATTDKEELDRKDFNYIQELNNGNSTGRPTYWAWYQNKIYLSIIPNAAWTITVFYQKKYSSTQLSGDSDTNDFTSYAEDLIEARARAWLYARVIKDVDQAQIAKTEEAEALAALREKTRKIIGTNYVVSSNF